MKKVVPLTSKQLNQTVYFYFKQDYSYRGLENTYKGKIKVSDLVEYEKLHIADEDTDVVTDRIWKALKFDSDLQYSFLDLDFPIVKKFLKKGSISAMGEIGYVAFSLKSIKEARALVAEMVLENEMQD